MYDLKSRVLTVSAVAVLLGLGGCATTSDLNEVKEHLAAVEATAGSAQADASEAKAMAADAKILAEESGVCCVETNEKIDRMFEKAQMK